MFGLSIPELALAAACLLVFLLMGVMIKKMGFSDVASIGLAILLLTPLNWLVLGYLVFCRWPIHHELEHLQRQVETQEASFDTEKIVSKGHETPLHVAARKGYIDVAQALIAEGADLNARNADGQTALQVAIAFEHAEITDLLRRHGATA